MIVTEGIIWMPDCLAGLIYWLCLFFLSFSSRQPPDRGGFAALPEAPFPRHHPVCDLPGLLGPPLRGRQPPAHGLALHSPKMDSGRSTLQVIKPWKYFYTNIPSLLFLFIASICFEVVSFFFFELSIFTICWGTLFYTWISYKDFCHWVLYQAGKATTQQTLTHKTPVSAGSRKKKYTY